MGANTKLQQIAALYSCLVSWLSRSVRQRAASAIGLSLAGFLVALGASSLTFAATPETAEPASVWLSDDHGLYLIDPIKASIRQRVRLPGVLALAADADGQVWAVANGTLQHYSKDAIKDLTLRLQQLNLLQANSLRIDAHDGSVWVSDGAALVHVNRAGRVSDKQLAPQTLFDQAVGLDQTLWLLGDKTLSQYGTQGEDHGRLLESIAIDGLPSQARLVAIDSLRQVAWVAGTSSLSAFDLTDAHARLDATLTEPPLSVVADGRSGSVWVLSSRALIGYTITSGHDGLRRIVIDLPRLKIQIPTHMALEQLGQSAWVAHSLGLSKVDLKTSTSTSISGFSETITTTPPFSALAAPAFDVNPLLTLREPALGSNLAADGRILFEVGALCPEGPCPLNASYFSGVVVRGFLGSASLESIAIDPATRQGQFNLTPAMGLTGSTNLSAWAVDSAGHRSATVNGTLLLPTSLAPAPDRPPSAQGSGQGIGSQQASAIPVDMGASTSSSTGDATLASSPDGVASTATAATALRTAPAAIAASGATHARPVLFELNRGQHAQDVKFYARAHTYEATLGSNKTSFTMHRMARADPDHSQPESVNEPDQAVGNKTTATQGVARITLVGARQNPETVGLDLQTSYSNYLVGNDKSKWLTHVPHYGRVQLKQVYPGIDEIHSGAAGNLRHDFIVAPGANPGVIRQQVDGASSLELTTDGRLVIHSAAGDLTLEKPHIYQDAADGKAESRIPITGGFILLGKNQFGFTVDSYDKNKPLIIDPTVIFETDDPNATVNFGETSRYSSFYKSSPVGTGRLLGIQKLSADGSKIEWVTYIGGSIGTYPDKTVTWLNVEADADGKVTVIGRTTFPDMPTSSGAYKSSLTGAEDYFLTGISADGVLVLASTYLFEVADISFVTSVVDSRGNGVFVGLPKTNNFPVSSWSQYKSGKFSISKININDASLQYSHRFGKADGGYDSDLAPLTAVDPDGNAFISSISQNLDTFPLTSGAVGYGRIDGNAGAWIVKFNAEGNSVLSAAQVFTNQYCYNWWTKKKLFAIDKHGDIYISMLTADTQCTSDKTTLYANPQAGKGFSNATVKLSGDLSRIIYSTFLEPYSDKNLQFSSIAADGEGSLHITGKAIGSGVCTSINTGEATSLCKTFTAKIDPTGQSIAYLTWDHKGSGSNIEVDASNKVHVWNGSSGHTIFAATSPYALVVKPSVTGSIFTGMPLSFKTQVVNAVGVPSGTVKLYEGSTQLAMVTLDSAGMGTLQPRAFGVGVHNLTAVYSGDAKNAALTTDLQIQVLSAIPTATTLTATLSGTGESSQVELSASVSYSSSGVVLAGDLPQSLTLKEGTKTVAVIPLSPSVRDVNFTVTSPSDGAQTYTAFFSGNAQLQPSQSDPAAVTVVRPLSILITTPATASNFIAPASLQLASVVNVEAGKTVSRVDYYQGSMLIGTSTAAPYVVAWPSVPTGSYIVTAKVTDNTGKAAASNAVTITVLDAATKPGAETITYLHTDVAGSPIAATNAAGNVVWRESYQPFGGRVERSAAASSNRQFFHGKPSDGETGLSYFGARYYDPVIGRFYGVDPKGPDGADWNSFNRYAYGNNNPYRFIDQDGKVARELVLGLFLIYIIGSTQYNNNPIFRGSTDQFVRRVQNVFSSSSSSSSSDGQGDDLPTIVIGESPESGKNNSETDGNKKPSLSDHKKALDKVHEEVGKLPKGEPGKYGSPQAGDSKKGYRLDPPHDGNAEGEGESKHHFNWWDWTKGKKGRGGRSGAVPIGED